MSYVTLQRSQSQQTAMEPARWTNLDQVPVGFWVLHERYSPNKIEYRDSWLVMLRFIQVVHRKDSRHRRGRRMSDVCECSQTTYATLVVKSTVAIQLNNLYIGCQRFCIFATARWKIAEVARSKVFGYSLVANSCRFGPAHRPT